MKKLFKTQHSENWDHGITSWQIDGETVDSDRLYFFGSKITANGDCSHEIKRHLLLGRKVMTNLDRMLKSRDITLLTKVLLIKAIVFSSDQVWMWELGYKESWVLKNWCFWTVVLEKTLESALDSKEIQPVRPKGNQSWILIGRTDAEAETPILWPPEAKNWLIRKDPHNRWSRCVWLPSLSRVFSGSVHGAARTSPSLLFAAEWYSIVFHSFSHQR